MERVAKKNVSFFVFAVSPALDLYCPFQSDGSALEVSNNIQNRYLVTVTPKNRGHDNQFDDDDDDDDED
eukprot:3368775-Amphidinium_carterae.1